MTTTDWASQTRGAGQYADVNGINLYYEIARHGPSAGPAPRRARIGRDVRAGAAGAQPPATRSSPSTCRATAGPPTSTGRSTSG